MNWQPYDPTWLVKLATEQYPNDLWVAHSLSECTKFLSTDSDYIYFIDPGISDDPDSEWGFERNVVLKQIDGLVFREVILDVLNNHKIGGLEIFTRVDPTS